MQDNTQQIKKYAKKLIKAVCKSKKDAKLELTRTKIGLMVYGNTGSVSINLDFEIFNEKQQQKTFKQMKKILEGK